MNASKLRCQILLVRLHSTAEFMQTRFSNSMLYPELTSTLQPGTTRSAGKLWQTTRPESSFVTWRVPSRAPPRILKLFLTVCFCVFMSPYPSLAAAQDDSDIKEMDKSNAVWLTDNGIEASQAGMRGYLKALRPDESVVEKALVLIKQLSSVEYLVREKATNDLKAMPNLTVATLRSIDSSFDGKPEGKYRLKEVIDYKASQNSAQIQFAIFQDIQKRELKGFASSIVDSFVFLEPDSFVQIAAAKALGATATESDSELLTELLVDTSQDNEMRAGALRGLLHVAPDAAFEYATKLKDSTKGTLGLEVARVLVVNEDEAAFEVLCRLFDDKSLQIRNKSLSIIRRMTNKHIGYHSVLDDAANKKAVKEVKAWLADNKNEVEYVWESAKFRLGRFIVSQYDANRVIEFDEAGKVVWSVDLDKPFACFGRPDGHRFVARYSGGVVHEYDASGKEVRVLKGMPKNISGMCFRENGNILIAAGQAGNIVMEVSPEGKEIKKMVIPGSPTSVEIGLNGNLIVALYGSDKIAEVDSTGKVLKTIKVGSDPYHVSQLESGNYLVTYASAGKMIEYDAAGKEVWELKCENYSYHAQELEDGTISYADSSGLVRVNRNGKKKVTKPTKSIGTVNYSYSY